MLLLWIQFILNKYFKAGIINRNTLFLLAFKLFFYVMFNQNEK